MHRCVVLALAGHDHEGGHAVIKHVHFVTVEAMLEGGCAWTGA